MKKNFKYNAVKVVSLYAEVSYSSKYIWDGCIVFNTSYSNNTIPSRSVNQ